MIPTSRTAPRPIALSKCDVDEALRTALRFWIAARAFDVRAERSVDAIARRRDALAATSRAELVALEDVWLETGMIALATAPTVGGVC